MELRKTYQKVRKVREKKGRKRKEREEPGSEASKGRGKRVEGNILTSFILSLGSSRL